MTYFLILSALYLSGILTIGEDFLTLVTFFLSNSASILLHVESPSHLLLLRTWRFYAVSAIDPKLLGDLLALTENLLVNGDVYMRGVIF